MQQVRYSAAGGVVIHDDKVLLLNRPNRREVRLPKGHIEEGESPPAAALREVHEEAGYAHLVIVADLGVQRVQFVDPYRKRRVIQDAQYFLMRLTDERQSELKEHQFIPVWVPLTEAVAKLTFEPEKEFVRRALDWIGQRRSP